MMRSRTPHRSHGSPNEYRCFDFAIRHIRNVRRLLNDLGDGFEGKVKEDFVYDCPRAAMAAPIATPVAPNSQIPVSRRR